MADYDSDSSAGDDVETNVLLGYASREPTSDDFSQLGGHPTWLDQRTAPSGTLAKCKVCNALMSLLLQINGDLPDKFPGHERRLYIWECRKKACRRKDGSVRGFRAIRYNKTSAADAVISVAKDEIKQNPKASPQPTTNLGETLFGVKSPTSFQANPFAPVGSANASSNPFAAASSLASKPPQVPTSTNTENLSETFAQKARISAPEQSPATSQAPTPHEPWPDKSAFPDPYPALHLDADKEYIEAEPTATPRGAQVDTSEAGSSAAEDKIAFESSMDKTFQRFADRLAQNPEQVLRYEFAGQPLLYSKTDAVGKLLAHAQEANINFQRIPRCGNCGAERVSELQLTPHAITELEAEEVSIEGMDWGTVILGVCGKDCSERGKDTGELGYVEEWVGVQWEELARGP